jgi:hypothetical protein
MKLIKESWYWVSDPNEGDIFYPVFIINDTHMLLDNEKIKIASAGVTFNLAIMPIIEELQEPDDHMWTGRL